MEFPKRLMPLIVEQVWLVMMETCQSHFKDQLMYTPRYLRCVTVHTVQRPLVGSLYLASMLGPPTILGLAHCQVKVISLVLLGSASRPLAQSHLSTSLYPSSATSVAAMVVANVTYMVLLSM